MRKEWKLVPVEPTDGMLEAGSREHAISPTNANPYHKYAAMIAAAPVHLPKANLEAAAKKLAACMDYPWEHMPEQGRASMREHATAVIGAALGSKQ